MLASLHRAEGGAVSVLVLPEEIVVGKSETARLANKRPCAIRVEHLEVVLQGILTAEDAGTLLDRALERW